MKGGYTTDPMREFKPWLNEDGTVADDGIERQKVVFEALQNKLMDRNNGRKQRRTQTYFPTP